MSGCYDKGLRCLAMEVAKELDVAALMQEGVYAMVGGPNFESIAEARLLHCLGADAVGKTRTHLDGSGRFWLVTAVENPPISRNFKYFNVHLTFKCFSAFSFSFYSYLMTVLQFYLFSF